MALQSDKKTLQGNVQPWTCDLCGAAFSPDLAAICSRCGRICCPEHRVPVPGERGSAAGESLCVRCAGDKPGATLGKP